MDYNNLPTEPKKHSKRQEQKSKDTVRVALEVVLECLYEIEDESDSDEDLLGVSEDSDDAEGSIANHMAFLDTFSEERKYPGCHCTKHICPGTSKVSLKIPSKQLSKVTKKCKKLYRRNVSMHQPLKSRDLLCELAEEILDLKFGQR